jgi:hypothetical protein
MSCLNRISSLFSLGLAIAFGVASSANASIIVANGKTYPNTVRVVATVQVAPTQDAGVTVLDPYHVTLTNPAATVHMRVLYWVNVDNVAVSSAGVVTTTQNAFTSSTIGISSATYGVLNIQNSSTPLTGGLSNSVLSPGLQGTLASSVGALKNSGVGDTTTDIGPALGQRVLSQNATAPTGLDWVTFAVAGGIGSGIVDGGTAIIGTAGEGGAGNVGVVSSTFDWVGTAGAAGSSTKVYYNPGMYFDEATANTNSKSVGITFNGAQVGMGPFNNKSGFPGATSAVGSPNPIHSTAELYMDPSYDTATLFGTYFSLAGVNNSPLQGAVAVTQALGIDGISGLRGTADVNGSLFGGVTINIPSVPEPGTIVLCGLGCVAIVGFARRRQG